MIFISNTQRDSIVRYLEELCDMLAGNEVKATNSRRLARKLVKQLKAKPTIPLYIIRRINRTNE